MRVPYGPNKEYFKYSLFLVFCNRITTSAVSAGVLLVQYKACQISFGIYIWKSFLSGLSLKHKRSEVLDWIGPIQSGMTGCAICHIKLHSIPIFSI